MYCPRCREPQAPGSRRCDACGYPFTRREVARQRSVAGTRPVIGGAGPGAYREWERGPGVARRMLGCLAVVVLTAVLIVAGVSVLSSEVIRPYVGEQIAERLGGEDAPQTQPGDSSPPQAAQQVPVPTVAIPTIAPGTSQLVITDDQLNQRIRENIGKLQPLDSASVEITPDGLTVRMTAYGVDGTYSGDVVARDGQVVVTNGRIDGPLGWVVPTEPIESALNQQVRAVLDQSDVQVSGVTLQEHQMTVALAPA